MALLLITSNVSSHGRWIVPSHSVLSGERPEVVTFDFSISNDIFHPDRGYGGIPSQQLETLFLSDENTSFKNLNINKRNRWTRLKVHKPDGSFDDSTSVVDFGRKSVAGYKMDQNGTYRVEVSHEPVYYVTYQTKQKKRARKFGRFTQIRKELPESATKIVATRLTNRVQTYVTRNSATRKNLEPASNGLDIVFDVHPNEFFKGESTEVHLFLHGKPLKKISTIRVTQGDTRYRNQRNTQSFKTDNQGKSTISWNHVGLLLIEVELANEVNDPDFTEDKFVLNTTVEVSQE